MGETEFTTMKQAKSLPTVSLEQAVPPSLPSPQRNCQSEIRLSVNARMFIPARTGDPGVILDIDRGEEHPVSQGHLHRP